MTFGATSSPFLYRYLRSRHMKTRNPIKSRLLFLVTSGLGLIAGSSPAGDLVYNLKPWGYEDPRAIPSKYTIGDGTSEVINGRRFYFIITDVIWDDVSKTYKYKKMPDFRMKL
jgi:hypothetical protein